MKVLVTGASGNIGSYVCALLDERWHHITTVSRSGDGLLWDSSESDWLRALERVDGVIHLAGESILPKRLPRWTRWHKQRIRQSRIETTEKLVDLIAKCDKKPSVFLQGSAVGFYGNGFLADVCRDWETASEPLEEMGVRRVCLRTGVVFQTEGGALAKMIEQIVAGHGGYLGTGEQIVPWIHVKDAAGMIVKSLEKAHISGPIDIVAPHQSSQQLIMDCLSDLLQKPLFYPIPEWLLRFVMGEMADMLLVSQPLEPNLPEYEFQFPLLSRCLVDLVR